MELDGGDPGPLLPAVTLLLHQQVEFVQPPPPGAVALFVMVEGFQEPHHRQAAFVFDSVAHFVCFLYRIGSFFVSDRPRNTTRGHSAAMQLCPLGSRFVVCSRSEACCSSGTRYRPSDSMLLMSSARRIATREAPKKAAPRKTDGITVVRIMTARTKVVFFRSGRSDPQEFSSPRGRRISPFSAPDRQQYGTKCYLCSIVSLSSSIGNHDSRNDCSGNKQQ